MNLCSDLEPELSRPVISQNIMDCNNVRPYEVWLQNDQRYKKYFGKSYSLIYLWAATVTLTLNKKYESSAGHCGIL